MAMTMYMVIILLGDIQRNLHTFYTIWKNFAQKCFAMTMYMVIILLGDI